MKMRGPIFTFEIDAVPNKTAISVIITVIFWNKTTFSVEIGVFDICTKSGSIFAAGMDIKYSKYAKNGG